MWAGSFLERGEGPVGEGREGLSTFFYLFFCITGIKIVFGLVFLVYFSKMFVVVVDSFLIFFFIVSCHAPFDSKFIIHKRQITQFDEFFFLSIRFFKFSRHFVDFFVDEMLFVYIVDVDDASEEKVVISEQHWEWFVLFLSNNIDQGSNCSFSFLLSPT